MNSLAWLLEERAAPQIPALRPRFGKEVAPWAPYTAAPRAGEGLFPDAPPGATPLEVQPVSSAQRSETCEERSRRGQEGGDPGKQ